MIFVFNIARNVGPKEPSKTLQKEVREMVERERVFEEKVQALDRSVPQEVEVLEALRQEVSALAERQRKLEEKLTMTEASS